MKKFKIKTQLIIVFLVLIFMTSITAIFSIFTINRLSEYSKETYNRNAVYLGSLIDVKESMLNLRRYLALAVLETTEIPEEYDGEPNYEGVITRSENALAQTKIDFEIFMKNIESVDGGRKDLATTAYANFYEQIEKPTNDILQSVKNMNYPEAYTLLYDNMQPMSDYVAELNAILNHTLTEVKRITDESNSVSNISLIISLILFFISLALSIILANVFGNKFSKRIINLSKSANQVSEGNFDVKIATNDKDELGILSRDLAKVIDLIKNINTDIDNLATKHDEGMISEKLDEDKYKGGFKSIVKSTNKTLDGLLNDINTFFGFVESVSNGDFSADMPKLDGEKANFNRVADLMKENLTLISSKITTFIDAINEGDLKYRADEDEFKGDWQNIIKELNGLMKVVETPINEVTHSLIEIEKGNFNAQITSNYKGSFAIIKETLNKTTDTLKGYIREISEILNKISNNELNVSIKNEYYGEFVEIKDAINTIIDTLNRVFGEFNSVAEQVLLGARQVSENTVGLAEGSTNQASVVNKLNSTIEDIRDKIKTSNEKSIEINNLSSDSKTNIDTGEMAMKNMLLSMDKISNASMDISKIIKVIEDIAFQTNLLALNAAVESARAGVHGKGFAVVAEEVRNLAARSQKAVGETNELIENSLSAVQEGTELAQSTDKALGEIVSSIEQMSNLISIISDLSDQEETSMIDISQGIEQVSAVVQQNTALAEENASSSEELSSQSEVLKNMINSFNLR